MLRREKDWLAIFWLKRTFIVFPFLFFCSDKCTLIEIAHLLFLAENVFCKLERTFIVQHKLLKIYSRNYPEKFYQNMHTEGDLNM